MYFSGNNNSNNDNSNNEYNYNRKKTHQDDEKDEHEVKEAGHTGGIFLHQHFLVCAVFFLVDWSDVIGSN